mmetsp:Transcript_6901/g.15726  ORF Transcript_6901/g.15726 Transcript_6901/m.15726 type:complete len:261 (-) Transcript_6901:24-806(-)|eukprot:CAMPEP_0206472630 /NCGR_PEP_ID=MMETSP0324_2-20121206/32333_1 /ASSEMBLY_ACC=CAM_ASM_000836 /TAXON_ID=2866 /ORGANISM="Crypthecodinium cohnii, Strain Seligo" /LENGTH=260 /DNA_ID=CAMNT_0053947303 /DNA_START=186 /DNA_END=968 /DNA_ORIENTATION=+
MPPGEPVLSSLVSFFTAGPMGNRGSTQPVSAEAVAEEDPDWPWVWAIRDVEVLDWRIGLDREQIGEVNRQQQLPVKITDTVMLGDKRAAQDFLKIEEYNITHILNMAGPAGRGPVEAYEQGGIAYLEIPAEDDEEFPLLQNHFAECRAFIAKARENGSRCLVHCAAGINRSGLVVGAEMMLSTRTTVLDVVKHCRRSRGNIYLGNEGFQAQLVALARQYHLLGPAPGNPASAVPHAPPGPRDRASPARLPPAAALSRLTG